MLRPKVFDGGLLALPTLAHGQHARQMSAPARCPRGCRARKGVRSPRTPSHQPVPGHRKGGPPAASAAALLLSASTSSSSLPASTACSPVSRAHVLLGPRVVQVGPTCGGGRTASSVGSTWHWSPSHPRPRPSSPPPSSSSPSPHAPASDRSDRPALLC
eukprot:755529-Hanusia_phi.AAC.5